jgi:hypothetical protein
MAARPIFEGVDGAAARPRRHDDRTAVVVSTDHVSFDNAGIPAFQFMVDRLEYNSRTHHSNMDTSTASSATT